ncbi:MAG: Asp-tRNA(Asn)/Glu-tRNA(Gln) amidotransferase subunit GatC [Gammaproteobacteria bacterium]|nr:Asp-tRNA(Asn)/Glu-tRNA(Gln) amidotransferase subunit GatC [Gammaproteobacteria bacterium]
MTISRSELEQLATLARLQLPTTSCDELSQQLTNIIDFFDQLNAVDTATVEPMAHPLDMVQRLREDVVTESDQRDKLQRSTTFTKDGLYLVPKVIE